MQDRPYILIGGILLAFLIAIAFSYWIRTRDVSSSPISSDTASQTAYAKKGTQRKGAKALVRTKNIPAPSKGGEADPNDIEIWGSLEPGGYQPDTPLVNSEFQTLDQIQDSSFSGEMPSFIPAEATPIYTTSSLPEDAPVLFEPMQPTDDTYMNAKRLFQEGKFSEAQHLLESIDIEGEDQATSVSSGEAENRVLLALTHSKQGHPEEGIVLLQDIMLRTETMKGVRDKRLVQAYRQAALHLSRLLRAQGRRDEADSVELDPSVLRSVVERSGSLSR